MDAMYQLFFWGMMIISMFVIGMPLALLSLEEKNKKIFFPFSMVTGAGVVIILAYYISYLGIGMKTFARPVLLFMCCCSIGVCVTFRKKILKLVRFENIDLIKIGILVVAGLIVLAPVILYNGGFTYTDTYTYVCIADVLQDIGYNKIVENNMYKPYLTQINLYQTQGYRIGAQMLLAFFTAIFSRPFSLELYSPVAALGVVLCGCAVWIFIDLNYRLNKMSSLIGVLLVALNVPVIIWSAIYGFLPQTYGLAFFMASFGMTILLIRDNEIRKINYVYCALYTALIGLVYNELIPFWVLSVFCFLVINIISSSDVICEFKNISKKICVLAILTIIILGPYFIQMIKAILAQLKVSTVGWEHPGGPITFLGYILGTLPADFYYTSTAYDKWNKFFYFALTMFLLIALFLATLRIYRTKKRIMYDLVASFLPFVIMLLYFSFFATNPFGEGKGNKWSIYKVVQYSTVIILPYSSILLSSLWESKKLLVNIVGTILVITGICNGVVYANQSVEPIRQLTGNIDNPIGEYYNLYEVYKNEGRTINLIGAPETHRKLVTYFLQDNLLMSNWGSDSYFYVYHDFVPKYDEDGITLYYNPYGKNTIANFEELQNLPVTIELGENFYAQEKSDATTWNWCSEGKGTLKILNYSSKEKVKVSFGLSCVDNNYADVIISNELGEVIETVSVGDKNKERVEIVLEFTDGPSRELHISYTGAEMITDVGRDISFCLWDVMLEAY